MAVDLPVPTIRLVAEAEAAGETVLAAQAGDVLLGDDEIALLDAPALSGELADLGDHAHVFVAHDPGLSDFAPVRADVRTADAHGLDLEQAVVRSDLGQLIFSELELPRAYERCRNGRTSHHPSGLSPTESVAV